MLKNIKNNQKGFSFVEIIVSLTIFVYVVMISTAIFQQVVVGQRREIAAQNAQESLRFITEVISKELRMTKRFTIGANSCESEMGLNFTLNLGVSNRIFQPNDSTVFAGSPVTSNELYFKNEHDECVKYSLNGGDDFFIDRYKEDGTGEEHGSTTPINVNVNNLEFVIEDSDDYSTVPRVTVLMDIVSGFGNSTETLKLQTTIAPRYYPE